MEKNCGCNKPAVKPVFDDKFVEKHKYFSDFNKAEKEEVVKNLGFDTGIVEVQNYPDEEDLTNVIQNRISVLKFKDKKYQPKKYSGKGRVFLRKNLITDICSGCEKLVNRLTQDMFLDENKLPMDNTIFVVQYDYDLGGDFIEIPENSTLLFLGGSMTNGTLIFHNTELLPTGLNTKTALNINILGSYRPGNIVYDGTYIKYWDGETWVELGKTRVIPQNEGQYLIYFGASDSGDKNDTEGFSKFKMNREDSLIFRIDSNNVPKYHYILIPDSLTTDSMSIYIDGQRSTAIHMYKTTVMVNGMVYSAYRTSELQNGEHDYQIKFYLK